MQALARRAAAPIYIAALFSSAALIFVLQPLFGRMVTPQLGGSPAVWNVSMAFFQGALLAGYLYAHLIARLKSLRLQAAIHALVLLAAWFVLPIQVSQVWGAPSSEHPALWLVGVLAVSVGAPFAAASATAPLLQSWYARTGRADAHDPYYLYAASNLGSFVGLLAYPVLIEPMLGVQAQGVAWAAAYVAVAALIALSAGAAIGANGPAPEPVAAAPEAGTTTWRERAYWMAAAAVPSALVLGVTLHITTDVASAPMLWVAPLALYLLTFVVAFARGGEKLAPATLFVHPAALALLLVCYVNSNDWGLSIAGILGGFFFSALVCHQALARTRPNVSRLTEFYFFVSLGGVLGGAFAAFLAPVIFNNVYEYPLALALACLFRPQGERWTPRLSNATLAGAVMMTLAALVLMRLSALNTTVILGALGAAAALMAAGWGGSEERPATLRYAFLAAGAVFAVLMTYIAFNIDAVFPVTTGAEDYVIETAQPWGMLILAAAFTTLAFVVHGLVQQREEQNPISDGALGAALPTLVLIIALVLVGERLGEQTLITIGLSLCGIALLVNGARPALMAGLVLLGFTIFFLDDVRGGRILTQERSFFGVLRTRAVGYPAKGDQPVEMRILLHGTTIHGAQLRGPPGVSRTPLTYYHPQTALGEAIMAGLATGDSSHLGLIGLGAGATACLTSPSDELTIFEIDPAVVRLSAREGGDFTYVSECHPEARIELGDARLQIAEEPDGSFDVIVVDAFSSDAIPAHLLTREAIALYLRKTSDRGIVILHLSNRNLALVSEAARVARDLGAPTLYRVSDRVYEDNNPLPVGLPASVMIVARSPEALALLPLYAASNWRVFDPPPGPAWSDDYINLPRALWDSLTGVEQCRVYPNARDCPGAEEGAAPATPGDPE